MERDSEQLRSVLISLTKYSNHSLYSTKEGQAADRPVPLVRGKADIYLWARGMNLFQDIACAPSEDSDQSSQYTLW